MELEERVRALEDELKVLKNEIKQTLLEIREQILLRTHPALRAEEAPSSPSEEQASPRRIEVAEQRYQSVQPPATPMEPGPGPHTQRREGGQEAFPWEGMPTVGPILSEEGRRPPSPAKDVREHAILAGLAGWAASSVRRIGREHTAKLVQVYAQAGPLTPEVRDMLLQLVALSDEENPPGEVKTSDMLMTLLKLGQLLGRGIEAGVLLALLEEGGLG